MPVLMEYSMWQKPDNYGQNMTIEYHSLLFVDSLVYIHYLNSPCVLQTREKSNS